MSQGWLALKSDRLVERKTVVGIDECNLQWKGIQERVGMSHVVQGSSGVRVIPDYGRELPQHVRAVQYH